MKEIITGVLKFLAIIIFFGTIASWIGRSWIYQDNVDQKKMEYCIGQQKSFDDCWMSVYRSYDYKTKLK